MGRDGNGFSYEHAPRDQHQLSGIMIGVLTFRREEQLQICVESIIKSSTFSKMHVVVVVGDNDKDSTVSPYATEMHQRIHIGAGSVAQGRQALLEHARSNHFEFLIFVDDDEVVSEVWLQSLLDVASEFPCGAVAGPVSPLRVPRGKSALYERARHQTGTVVESAGAGNLLIRIGETLGVDFDMKWSLPGGEDTDYTLRLTKNDIPIVWADEADAYEEVVSSRLGISWLVRRYFLNGRIIARARQPYLAPSGSRTTARFITGIIMLCAAPFGVFSSKWQRQVLDKGVRQLGYVYESVLFRVK